MGDADGITHDAGVASGVLHGDIGEHEMGWIVHRVVDSLHVVSPAGFFRPSAVHLKGVKWVEEAEEGEGKMVETEQK